MLTNCHQFKSIHSKLRNKYHDKVREEVTSRSQKGDFIIHNGMTWNLNIKGTIEVCGAHGGGRWIPQRNTIFVTPDHYQHVGLVSTEEGKINPKVILPWFYREGKPNLQPPPTEQYLFLARCQRWKGLHLFLEIAKLRPDATFVIAGGTVDFKDGILTTSEGFEGITEDFDLKQYPNVRYEGVVGPKKRHRLLSESTALIQLTTYREPCGWNVIEAMLVGTPVITSAWGGFVDTVKEGVGGLLVNHEDDFTEALEQVRKLDRRECYTYARNLFSEDRAYTEYLTYFKSL